MEYMVCVKAVPDENEEIHLDKSGQPAFSETDLVGGAFERCALELAVRRKEASGGRVTVVSMGAEPCRGILKNCIAVGADRGIRIREKENSGNTVQRAKVTAEMVRQKEKEQGKMFDVILCGVESTDLGNGVFGPALAEFLGRPYVVNAKEIEETEDGILVTKETETGYEILKMPLPAVIMVTKTEFNPRYPTLKSKMAARKAEIEEWEDKEMFNGTAMAPGEMLRADYTEPEKKKAGIRLDMTEPEAAAEEAVKLIKTRM